MAHSYKPVSSKIETEPIENKSDSSSKSTVTLNTAKSASRAKKRPKSEEQPQKPPEKLKKRSASWCVVEKYDNPVYPCYNQETTADEETKDDSGSGMIHKSLINEKFSFFIAAVYLTRRFIEGNLVAE